MYVYNIHTHIHKYVKVQYSDGKYTSCYLDSKSPSNGTQWNAFILHIFKLSCFLMFDVLMQVYNHFQSKIIMYYILSKFILRDNTKLCAIGIITRAIDVLINIKILYLLLDIQYMFLIAHTKIFGLLYRDSRSRYNFSNSTHQICKRQLSMIMTIKHIKRFRLLSLMSPAIQPL